MSEKMLMKGNEALGEGAILAGCRHYFAYPITPQNEVSAYLSRRLGEEKGCFVQAESEVAAINMVYGAASAGARTMTSSSSPGISLMQEGLSYAAGAELPCVVANVVRGGPGLGNIAPAQCDYHQACHGGGHGDYHLVVLAPSSVQEMADYTIRAFDLADEFRNPVMILTDGVLGQMMEPVVLPPKADPATFKPKPWALTGARGRKRNLTSTIHLEPEELEQHNWHLYQKYECITKEFQGGRHQDLAVECVQCDDAELVLVGYGIVARILKTVVEKCRKRGIKAGLIRPKAVWPFPTPAVSKMAGADHVKQLMVVEMSLGQMLDDVKLAVAGRKPVYFYGRTGGGIPSPFEILNEIDKICRPDAD